MKATKSESKDALVFVREENTFSTKNEIENKSTVWYKFNSILKILVYLLLALVLIRIGYVLLIFHIAAETQSKDYGTILSVREDEIIVPPMDRLKTMTSEEQKKLMDYLRTLKDFVGNVDELEDHSMTAETSIEISTKEWLVDDELPASTVDSRIDDLVVTTSINDYDDQDEDSWWMRNKEETTKVSDFNEKVMDSTEFSDGFNNTERFDIPSSEITWLDTDVSEDSYEETNEELESAEWNKSSSFAPISILTYVDVNESNEKSTSTSYEKSSTSIKMGDDTVEADFINSTDVEIIDTDPEVPTANMCKISFEEGLICESDEDTSTDTESPLDATQSTVEDHYNVEIIDTDPEVPTANMCKISFEKGLICESDEDTSTKTESPLDATQSTVEDYYNYYGDIEYTANYDIEENEEEVEEEIQGNSMEEEKKQDNVSEKVVDDENDEVIDDYSALSTARPTDLDSYLMIFRTIPEIENPTESPSSIETESADTDDDTVSDEDIDESWDTLSSILESVEEDTTGANPSSEEFEIIYLKMLCILLDKYLQDIVTNPAFNLTDDEQLDLTVERMKILDAAVHDGNNYGSDLDERIDAVLRGEWAKKVKRSVEYMSKNHENLTGRLSDEEKVTKRLRDAIHMEEIILVQKMGQMDDSDYQSLEASLEKFFDRMEFVSQHIDRLHNRYLELNELNDDYVSREFPVEPS